MNGLAAIALLLVASSSTNALKCYSCGSAKLREVNWSVLYSFNSPFQDLKGDAAFNRVFDRRPLNFTDQCNSNLTGVRFLESCPKGDSCLRFTFRHTAKGYDAIVRGCTQRILLQNIADSVGVEELGCHEFSEEEFGSPKLCTCNTDRCNGIDNGASSLISIPLFATLLVGFSFTMNWSINLAGSPQ